MVLDKGMRLRVSFAVLEGLIVRSVYSLGVTSDSFNSQNRTCIIYEVRLC